jgi:hypothetical protein
MRQLILPVFVICLFGFEVTAQPWVYNFGTATGNHTAGVSTTFLPAPPTGGGNSRVRIGAGGSFNLENPGITSLGTATELRAVASSSGSVNKMSVSDYTAGTSFTIRFKMRLDGGASGTWYLFMGDGTSYSNNAGFTGTEVFTGLQWIFGAGGTITTNYRNAGAWAAVPGTPFVQATDYDVEIYGNNTAAAINYDHAGTNTVASYTYDLWINGTLIGDDLAKALLANLSNIDSWMLYGENSTGNVATIYLDDFIYTNTIALVPLPIKLQYFNAVKSAAGNQLTWKATCSSTQAIFDVQRSVDGKNFEDIHNIVASQARCQEPFVVTDNHLNGPKVYYRIQMTDVDGKTSYSPIAVIVNKQKSGLEIVAMVPNPVADIAQLSINTSRKEKLELVVVNAVGKIMQRKTIQLEAGSSYISLDLSGLAKGIYFIKGQGGAQETNVMQFSKL